jgi:hypothetical protein
MYKELEINSLEWRTSWSSVQVYSHTLAVKVFHSLTLSQIARAAVNQSRSGQRVAARLECRRMTSFIYVRSIYCTFWTGATSIVLFV